MEEADRSSWSSTIIMNKVSVKSLKTAGKARKIEECMMKKMLSLLTVAALLAQSADMSAMDTARQFGRGARAVPGQIGRSFGQYVGAPMQAQGAKIAAWAGPFLLEVGNAIQIGNFQALPGIVRKYKAQSGAAGAALVAVIATMAALFVRSRRVAGRSSKAASIGRRHGVNLENQSNRDLLHYAEEKSLKGVQNIFDAQQNVRGLNIVDHAAIAAAIELAEDADIINHLKLLKNILPLEEGVEPQIGSRLVPLREKRLREKRSATEIIEGADLP